MRALRRWAVLVLAAALVLIAGLLTVILNIDPNRYKTQIVDLARTRAGLWLRIDGDLHWTMWPHLGLDVSAVTVDWQAQPATPLATFGNLTLDVDLLPLLSSHPALHIGGLRLDAARINLIRYANGATNWQRPASDRSADAAGNNDAAAIADIALHRLRITRSALTYTDARTHARDQVTGLRLELQDALPATSPPATSPAGAAPPAAASTVRAAFRLQRASGAVADVALSGNATFGAGLARVALRALDLTIDVGRAGNKPGVDIALLGDINYDLHTDRLDIPNARLTVAGVTMTLSLHDATFVAQRHLQGTLALPEQNVNPLLAALGAAPGDRPWRLGVSTRFDALEQHVTLSNFVASYGGTQLRGALMVQTTPRLSATFDLDAGDLLLAGGADASASTAPGTHHGQHAPPTVDMEASLLPLGLLRDVDWTGHLRARSLQYRTVRYGGVVASTRNNRGEIQVDLTASDFMQGTLRGGLRLDVRTDTPLLQANIDARGVDSKRLPMQVMKKVDLTARLDIKGELHGAGNTRAALANTVTGALNFDGGRGTLDTRAIKREAGGLEALAAGLGLVGAGGRVLNWPDIVQYSRLNGALQLHGLADQTLTFALDNLHADAKGSYSPAAQQIDYVVTFKISNDPMYHSFDVAEFLQDVPWSMRCKGSLNSSEKLCRLERGSARAALLAILEHKSAHKLEQKVGKALGTDAAGLRDLLEAFGHKHKHKNHAKEPGN